MSVPSSGKKVVVSVGPIPARLDSVKFVTNGFTGGLAVRTAYQLAKLGHDVTIVAWKYTDVPSDIMSPEPDHDRKAGDLIEYPGVREVVRVADVLEYYDWFVANAKNYDAFVMAAAVANLTPVKPYEGKFPSHLYKPGDEFDIKFMIAPRAIDAVKQINPRACLVGYKLFDTPDDDALIRIARHTLADAKANIIFANRPSDAKTRKIAVTADGATFETDFNGHVNLIDRAIRQEYFRTKVSPLTDKEKSDPEVAAAFALVERFEKTFDGYGTVAFPAGKGRFATTARGHRPGGPVLVRCIDPYGRVIHASGKATLNAPLLSRLVRNDAFVVHRHYDDPLAQTANDSLRPHDVLYGNDRSLRNHRLEEIPRDVPGPILRRPGQVPGDHRQVYEGPQLREHAGSRWQPDAVREMVLRPVCPARERVRPRHAGAGRPDEVRLRILPQLDLLPDRARAARHPGLLRPVHGQRARRRARHESPRRRGRSAVPSGEFRHRPGHALPGTSRGPGHPARILRIRDGLLRIHGPVRKTLREKLRIAHKKRVTRTTSTFDGNMHATTTKAVGKRPPLYEKSRLT